jgi:hypothetical protein
MRLYSKRLNNRRVAAQLIYLMTVAALGLICIGAAAASDSQSAVFSSDAGTEQSLGDAAQPEQLDAPADCQNPTTNDVAFDLCKAQNGRDVEIGAGAFNKDCQSNTVVFNADLGPFSGKVGKIQINAGGVLVLNDVSAKDFNLETTGIDINGGSLLIGSAKCPIGTINSNHNVTITFTGPKPSNCGILDKPATCDSWVKGIQVDAKGTLRMYGLKGVAPNGVSWTYLSQPAGNPKTFSKEEGVLAPPPQKANSGVMYTAVKVDSGSGAWRPKDWIAVATTSFSPWETEFVQIDSVKENTDKNCGPTNDQNCGASKITLKDDLHFYHFGGPDPGVPGDANDKAGAPTNYGVDERAEVGLISRNIILTSDSDEGKASNHGLHWGGELKFLKDFAAVSLQGVELQKFGKEQLGSYPIHFHQDGSLSKKAPADVLVDSNSIDHSYNKCITTHSTSDLSYTNNVCARITGHIFYEEVGDESNVTFKGNLGMGAMSNSFDVNEVGNGKETRKELIKDFYWVGDNMTQVPIPGNNAAALKRINYDQFKIFDADTQYSQQQRSDGIAGTFITVRGQCASGFDKEGKMLLAGAPDDTDKTNTCYPANASKPIYFEPPTGFWILNPSVKLIGNSIAGCQDTGSAYWYLPPPDPSINAVKFIPIGPNYTDPPEASPGSKHGVFMNNRGHGCYRGLIDDQFEVPTADSLFAYQKGENTPITHPMVDEFDGVTLSRIRYRGVWLRPVFYYLKDARLATNERSISFVTSGGADGNYPGVWSLLGHSTMVGISQNNVDRFGPCGSKVFVKGTWVRGAMKGCIDLTAPESGVANGGEFLEQGYPDPNRNMFGFMSYDGPPLMVNDRFVNFLVDPSTTLLTKTDQTVLSGWTFSTPFKHYEGDAAIGWLESNQSAYPTAASTKQLSFDNVDLRHQVFTDIVNLGAFNDGDQNTSILDLDGTLSGYKVGTVDMGTVTQLPHAFPASLNNLPFNASSNSIDECKATGQQNTDSEGRPTAAMVPSGIGQFELEALYPDNNPTCNAKNPGFGTCHDHSQLLTFYKDTLDFNQHGSMSLHSRNGLGIWEPKVASGYGYVVRADPYTVTAAGGMQVTSGVGIPPVVDLSIVDTVKPIDPTHPFYVQLGICYSKNDVGGTHPAGNFTITRGYKSWGGGNLQPGDQSLRQFFNQLQFLADANQWCFNTDSQNPQNMGTMPPLTGCPTVGVSLQTNGGCLAGGTEFTDQQGKPACKFPTSTLSEVEPRDIKGMTTDGTLSGPPNLDKYFYDSNTGMLYLWIVQTDANAAGPSPLGNCTGQASDPPFCPQLTNGVSTGEPYYNCPAEGCSNYRITLNDPTYTVNTAGQSTCPVFGTATGNANDWLNGTAGVTWPAPPTSLPIPVLYDKSTNEVVTRTEPNPNPAPHYAPASNPTCQ